MPQSGKTELVLCIEFLENASLKCHEEVKVHAAFLWAINFALYPKMGQVFLQYEFIFFN